MKIAVNNTLSITPNSTGSFVQIEGVTDQTFVVVAWAVVCTHIDENGMETAVQPVFVVDGDTYTTAEWYQLHGTDQGIKLEARQ